MLLIGTNVDRTLPTLEQNVLGCAGGGDGDGDDIFKFQLRVVFYVLCGH